jgi:hypothetical protein
MKSVSVHFRSLLAVLVAAMLPVLPASAQYYGSGNSSVASFSLGTGSQFGQDYTVIAGRYGRTFASDFEATLGLELWRGSSPDIYKITPELRYVPSSGQTFKPYAGLFYSRSFYSNSISNQGSFGVRGGMYYVINPSAYLGLGLVYERMESCDTNVFTKCSDTTPEVSLRFLF